MAKYDLAPHENNARLDNLTLARKEGWQRFVNTAARIPPEPLSRGQLRSLSEEAFDDYNRQRRKWHANLGPIRTPQLAALHEDLWDIVDSNAQDGDKAKGAVAIEAFPGLGKTTSVLDFAKKFHRREVNEQGTVTDAGAERWPVCRVGLTGNTGMVEFNRAMLAFFAHPGTTRGNAAHFAHRALDCVLSCETKLLIVDDLHFLRWRNTVGVEISNHFKYIANEFPVTLVFVGVGLTKRGLFSEGHSYEDAVIAQTGRRTTKLDMRLFEIDTDDRRREWRQMLLAIEQRVVLAEKRPGMLADELSDYLFARSTGHIGSLMTLINRGCQRAVRTGAEYLSRELMDQVKNDAASEKARQELEAAFNAQRLTTRIGKAG
ncbi:AAA family ATPase [[Mycobacterium] kokjensenii]|uniref:AAA family ATPase n=2 Tax=Mycobacteriaceae TaxID=1762 RepID=A0A1X2EJV0_9MYCO|nr:MULTISPECIES: AAA family ATPase [Mycobacteriaceae]ORX04156.1 AAA family ATPase [Mycolicibacillus trivialis]CAJ1506392.1 AAA family ATPase [Mycolicibacter sp. MU0083]